MVHPEFIARPVISDEDDNKHLEHSTLKHVDFFNSIIDLKQRKSYTFKLIFNRKPRKTDLDSFK